MKATDILMSEHRVIERVINALDIAASRLEQGQPVRSGFFLDASDFIRGFADGCHHKKEENVLFKELAANGLPVEGGPIGVMLHEHEEGRAYNLGMRDAAQRLEGGEEAARPALLRFARGYANLLRQHIFKENMILFPMAERVIPPDEQDGVVEGFRRVEHEEAGEGVHEKYLRLAEKLEAEAGG
jgi:hemerythrin-like domain-containing protein